MDLYLRVSSSLCVLLAFLKARRLHLISFNDSSESHESCFLFCRRQIIGMLWSAAMNKRSLKLVQASSMDSVRKQQFHGTMYHA